MPINLTVVLKSKEELTTTLKEMLLTLVAQSTQETACLQYDLHQSVDDSNTFIFHEIWENEAGLQLHNEQPYLIEFFEKAKPMLQVPPTIYFTNKLS